MTIHTREQLIHEIEKILHDVYTDNHCFDTDIEHKTAVKICDLIATLNDDSEWKNIP
jgi:hypothetical protein